MRVPQPSRGPQAPSRRSWGHPSSGPHSCTAATLHGPSQVAGGDLILQTHSKTYKYFRASGSPVCPL